MPSTDHPVTAPAGAVPQSAVSFANAAGRAVVVTGDTPLPTVATIPAATSIPLVGSAGASGVAGPFVPQIGRAIRVTLTGTWSGSAQLLRSTDGGVTRLPITAGGQAWGSFTANANEAVTEEGEAGATYHLALTVQSGTIAYRVAQ